VKLTRFGVKITHQLMASTRLWPWVARKRGGSVAEQWQALHPGIPQDLSNGNYYG
jgi:hypothetical protein